MVQAHYTAVHRKIRAVAQASDRDCAIEKSLDGLENAIDDEILPDGNLTTVTGEHTPLSPSTYFNDNREKTAYKTGTPEADADLTEALQHTREDESTFVYTIDDRDGLTASPISSEQAHTQLVETLETKTETHWVVTFDLRYDFDATPHKPHEILDT